MEVLDNDSVEAALKRVDGRDHFGLVELQYRSPEDDGPQDDAG
jgi:hypothetical protein